MKPIEQQATAYKLYLQGNLTIPDISEKCGVPSSTLKTWIKDGNWRDRKMELNDSVMNDVETELREKSGAVRFEFLDRELQICRELENRILVTLQKRKEDGTPSYLANTELGKLSKALKDVGERVSGLLGLDHNRANDDNDSLAGARMLVVVGRQPREISAGSKDITAHVIVGPRHHTASRQRPF
jgi:transposase-like protein